MDDAVRKLYLRHFQENMILVGDMAIYQRTGKVLEPEIGYTPTFKVL